MSRKKAMKIRRKNICFSTFLTRKWSFPESHAASLQTACCFSQSSDRPRVGLFFSSAVFKGSPSHVL
ncbi:MAG: hypothetical protein JWQ50_814 [Caballeronia mineralivorans]|jgi:hypothetical protein|nr:hypothetical protein [Caballeronia mineralivorans]MEA3102361.1 hypothetical protein [Caballeronia mineralivorans]